MRINGGRTGSSNANNNISDLRGDELFCWALNDQPHFPTSTTTVRVAKEVDVFSLEECY